MADGLFWWCFLYFLYICQEAGDPLTDGGGDGELCQFILKGVRDDGVKRGAEVYKQDPHISPHIYSMNMNIHSIMNEW